VLIVDDDPNMCGMLQRGLREADRSIDRCSAADEAMKLLSDQDYDVVVSDLRMRGLTGIALCEHVAEHRPDLPEIVITAFGSMEAAVDAMRAGAFDFITKPYDLDALRVAVKRALDHRRLVRRLHRLGAEREAPALPRRLIGASPEMLRLFALIDRVAPFSTRSRSCRSGCSRSSCGRCRSAPCGLWGGAARYRLAHAFSPPPMRTWTQP
jgi:two-component system response regulator HydG